MLFRVVLVCIIFGLGLVTADVYSEIRSEEEKRHNATLNEYLSAALGGALKSLFPSVTNAEIAEADKLFGEVYPIGDPSRPLPDNEERIETLLCKNHRERGVKILAYIRKRWPTHLILAVAARLSVYSIGAKNDEYCSNPVWRSIYTKNATVINERINELSVARNKYIDQNMVIVHGNATINKLAALCCSFWNFKTNAVNAIPAPQTKKFLTEYIDGYNGPAAKYLCVYHSEGSKACADLVIPPPPTNVPRFPTFFSAGIESVSKLTSISA